MWNGDRGMALLASSESKESPEKPIMPSSGSKMAIKVSARECGGTTVDQRRWSSLVLIGARVGRYEAVEYAVDDRCIGGRTL